MARHIGSTKKSWTGRYTTPERHAPVRPEAATTAKAFTTAGVSPPLSPASGRKAATDCDRSGQPGRLDRFVERRAPDVLGVTYWFTPTGDSTSATIRFTGRRLQPTGAPDSRDRFLHDETVETITPDTGPVAVTVRVPGVNRGQWAVTAELLAPPRLVPPSTSPAAKPGEVHRAGWSWLRWRLSAEPDTPLATCPSPYVRSPGLLRGAWPVLAFVGVVVALASQRLVISAVHVHLHAVLAVSVPAVAGGIVGAKAWFIVVHRRDRRRQGWCVQGLVAGVSGVAVTVLALTGTDIGAFLDVTAPGLMAGLAVGRIGCLLAGCCAGRPTTSRWGVWSSDRRLGVRRVATQLLEAGLAAAVSVAALSAVLRAGPRHGGLFLAALAGYTLVRQALLRLRAERRNSTRGGPITAAVAAAGLAAGIVMATVA